MLHMPISEIIEKISKKSKLSKEEIKELIKKKTDAHDGLVSKEGAAYIVAHDLDIELFKTPTEKNPKIKIKDLVVGMRTFEITGKIINISPIHTFKKQGKTSQVGNINIADKSETTRIVLWDQKADLIKENKVKTGQVITIKNGNTKSSNFSPNGKEIHITKRSRIILDVDKKIDVEIPETNKENVVKEKKLNEIKAGERIETRGVIVKIYPPAFYDSCPKCNKKVINEECREHGKCESIPAMVLSTVVDDSTEAVRCTAFNKRAEDMAKMSGTEAKKKSENPVLIQEELNKTLLGKEIKINGFVKDNKQFNRMEININSADKNLNPIKIAKEMLKSNQKQQTSD